MRGERQPDGRIVVWMPDTEGVGNIRPETWRLPIPDTPEGQARQDEVLRMLFEVAYGTPEQRSQPGGYRPFYELPADAVAMMPDSLRGAYYADCAYAQDPRSGQTFVPYVER